MWMDVADTALHFYGTFSKACLGGLFPNSFGRFRHSDKGKGQTKEPDQNQRNRKPQRIHGQCFHSPGLANM